MKVSRVLLVTKTTLLELAQSIRTAQPVKKLIDAQDPLVADEKPEHLRTLETIKIVRDALKLAGITVDEATKRRRAVTSMYDMVVAVGGDGTVLDIARFIDSVPLVAVNSSPATSYGHFCSAVSEARFW